MENALYLDWVAGCMGVYICQYSFKIKHCTVCKLISLKRNFLPQFCVDLAHTEDWTTKATFFMPLSPANLYVSHVGTSQKALNGWWILSKIDSSKKTAVKRPCWQLSYSGVLQKLSLRQGLGCRWFIWEVCPGSRESEQGRRGCQHSKTMPESARPGFHQEL